MKKNKNQLHEALSVLLTKLSSARDNPLLIDNYAVKALRTVLLDFKESGELHEAYKEQIQSTLESDSIKGQLAVLSVRPLFVYLSNYFKKSVLWNLRIYREITRSIC